MNKSFKLALASAALAAVVAGTPVLALANEEAAAPAVVTVEEGKAYVVGADGAKTVAADGAYKDAEGKDVVVKDGAVVAE